MQIQGPSFRKSNHACVISLLLMAFAVLPPEARAQPEIEIEFIRSFGTLGTAPGQFNFFGGVTVDNAGLIYITDNSNHRIQICDYEGNCEVDGGSGSALGQFRYPIGIALDQNGRIVASDGQNFRIQIRDLQGIWKAFGSQGDNAGQFRIPGGVAVDAQNQIYVADENNERVQACDDQGQCAIVADGFVTPRSVAFDSKGRLVISDRGSNRIHICVPNGPCTDFGSAGTAPGRFRAPTEVWVDAEDRIFITDRDNDRFQVCDLEGACIAFGQSGTGPGQFRSPTAVAVDSQNRIIIGDSDNNRIQIFQAMYPPPNQPMSFTIGGTVSGLVGSGLVLQNNGGDDLAIAANGAFTFATALPDGSSYAVSVLSQPGDPGQSCTVGNGSGSLAGANVTDVSVNCVLESGILINAGLSDAWFNPATDGQGFFIIVFPEISVVFMAWFTYDVARPQDDIEANLGEPGHRWITAQGPYDGGTAILGVTVTRGGVFGSGEPVPENRAEGSIELVFGSCAQGLVRYDLPGLGLMGEVPIQRVVNDNVPLCESLAE